MEYELYLTHSGVPNMTWGARRYQYKDGSLTPLGKIHYRKLRREKAEGDNPRHKPSEARKKAKYEEARKNLLENGTAHDLAKYRAKYNITNDELKKATTRIQDKINLDATLSSLMEKEAPKGKPVVDKILDTADKWRERGEKFKRIYNFTADVHNSFVDEDDAWQKLGEPNQRLKRAKEKLEREAKKAKEEEEYNKHKMAIEAKVYKNLNVSTDELLKYSNTLNKKDFEDVLTYMKSEKDRKEALNKQKQQEKQQKQQQTQVEEKKAKPEKEEAKPESKVQVEEKKAKPEKEEAKPESKVQNEKSSNLNPSMSYDDYRKVLKSMREERVKAQEEKAKKKAEAEKRALETRRHIESQYPRLLTKEAKVNKLMNLMRQARATASKADDEKVRKFFIESGLSWDDYDLASELAGKKKK